MTTKLAMRLAPCLLAALLLSACGDDQTKKENPAGNQNGADHPDDGANPGDVASLADDSELAGETVAAQIDEAISASVEENDQEAATLALAGADAKAERDRFRQCTAADGKAVVELRESVVREWTFDGPARNAESKLAAYRKAERTWSREGGEIACNDGGKFAAVPLADMQGVSLAVSFERERSRETKVTFKHRDLTVERSRKVHAEGTRNVTWKSVAEDGDLLVLEKEVTGHVERTLETKNKKGEEASLGATVTNADDAPLLIRVERDKTTLDVVSRTIVSGELVATGKDGGVVQTSFDAVKYTPEGRCTPISGKITGAIFAKDAAEGAEPVATYEITFAGDDSTIVFTKDGQTSEYEYSGDGCEGWDDPVSVQEAASADDVVAPEGA